MELVEKKKKPFQEKEREKKTEKKVKQQWRPLEKVSTWSWVWSSVFTLCNINGKG